MKMAKQPAEKIDTTTGSVALVPARGGDVELKTTGNVVWLADLASEADEFAGAGVSQSADDMLIPFLSILQDMSPQVKKRDPEYVEGAEVGMIISKATKRLWSGETGVLFQPCAYNKSWVEWIPREDGGGGGAGYVGQHADIPEDAVGEKDPKTKRTHYSRDGNDLIETKYQYGNVIDEATGDAYAAVISFSATGHTAFRQWQTLMNGHKLRRPDGTKIIAPSWYRLYRLRSTPQSNSRGEWMGWDISDHGWVEDRQVREEGKRLYLSITSGERRAAPPVEDVGAREIPF